MLENTLSLIEKISVSLKPGSHPGLSRVLEFCSLCGHPEQKLKTVHVAGTNGKGSVSNMMRLILTESGYKTAVFNSPFLSTPLEYFQIDGEQISEERFSKLCTGLLALALQLPEPPTEFEFYTVAALVYFLEEQCDFAVIEAGMGGRLDATNVLQNQILCMITNIGIDHKEYLGDTIEQIAKEKAGIIKPGIPVAVYASADGAVEIIRQAAIHQNCCCVCVDENRMVTYPTATNVEQLSRMQYVTANGKMYSVRFPGNAGFQFRNCALVLEAVELLKERSCRIPEDAVYNALQKFHLPARFEVLSEEPIMIADGGHNAQCIDAVMESMQGIVRTVRQRNGRIIVLTGIMRDKDYRYVYRRLSEIADEYILVAADVSRAMTTEELETELLQYGKPVTKAVTPQSGASLALEKLSETDCLLVSGSFYIMSDILSVLRQRNGLQI